MESIQKLLDLMRQLRDKDNGCPWDVRQSFASIAPYTVEEAYEVADAIERGDMHNLRAELGDLLFQVVFHAQMADEIGEFDFDDVARGITAKMMRRHPHVFGNDLQRALGGEEKGWEEIKALERSDSGDQSALAGVALALPALKRAQKLGKRAHRVGFDWPDRKGVRDKIQEELYELEEAVGSRQPEAMEEEFGDLLFSIVNLARHLEIDPENALAAANYKFERRFRDMEQKLADSGKQLEDLGVESLDRLWRKAKKRVG